MRLTIRRMAKPDAQAVSDLVSGCYRFLAGHEGYARAQFDSLLRERCSAGCIQAWLQRYDCFVACSTGAVLGVVAVRGNEIEELFVRPQNHREGVGTRLFTRAERIIRNGGHRKVVVATSGYGVPFYQRMGAHISGAVRCRFGPLKGRVLVVLEKPLGILISAASRPED